MTAPSDATPNPAPEQIFPLAFGASAYFAALQGQLESTLQLTTAWTTAMTAFSSTILAPAGTRSAQGTPRSGFPGLRAVPSGGDSTPVAEHVRPQRRWPRQTYEPHMAGGMLRWLTEPPTLQPDLFDEVVELLVDEDIKTAS